jgi:hypothetical protein
MARKIFRPTNEHFLINGSAAEGEADLSPNRNEKLPADGNQVLSSKSHIGLPAEDNSKLGEDLVRNADSTDHAWENLGGKIIGEPVIVSGDGKRLDVFFQGTDRKIYHKWRDGNKWMPSQTEYKKVGEVFSDGISAVAWGPERLDIFARGKDNSIWHGLSWDGQRFEWKSLDGNAIGKPVAVTWGVNRLDIFAQFVDGALWHKWWDGREWQHWESLGGKILGVPAPVAWGPGRLDVCVRGTDNSIHHQAWNGSSWSGWRSLGGSVASSPAQVSWNPGRLDIFVEGIDQPYTIFHRAWADNAWRPSKWQVIGGSSISGPRAVAAKPDLLDIVIQGPDRAVWQKSWNGSSWVPDGDVWLSRGGSIDGPPVLSPLGSLQLEVFARGTNEDLMHWS